MGNRLDDIIVFRPLKKSEIRQICSIMLKGVFKRAACLEITISITETFIDKLVEVGFNHSFGARPLSRAITRLVEDPIAETILSGKLNNGESAIIDFEGDN